MLSRPPMRSVRHKSILCILLAALCLQLAACVYRPEGAKTRNGETLFRLGFSGRPDSLNPYAAGNDAADAVLRLLYDTLFQTDPATGECVPSLCESYAVRDAADGGKLWDLTLRTDVLWHDGNALTASDVEFSLQSAKDYSVLHGYPDCELLDVTGIAVKDDAHLSMVVWGEEDYILRCLAAVPILPRHVWNQPEYMDYDASGVAADPIRAGKELPLLQADECTLIGSGLYRFEAYADSVCTLRRNDAYWGDKPQAEVLRLVFDLDDPAYALRSGTIDACWDLSLQSIRELDELRSSRTAVGSGGERYAIAFHFSDASSPVQSLAVRQALGFCVDRAQILSRAFAGGYAETGFFSPFHCLYGGDPSAPDDYDPRAAAELLAKDGWEDGNGDGILEKNGIPLRLRLLCSSEGDAWLKAAEILYASLLQAGIGLEIVCAAPEEMNDYLFRGSYDLYLTSFREREGTRFPYIRFYWDGGDNAAFTSDARGRIVSRGWNACGYADEEYDALFRALMNAAGEDAVEKAAGECAQYLSDVAAEITIGFAVRYQACSAVWSGLVAENSTGLYFTPDTIARQMQSLCAGKRIDP